MNTFRSVIIFTGLKEKLQYVEAELCDRKCLLMILEYF